MFIAVNSISTTKNIIPIGGKAMGKNQIVG